MVSQTERDMGRLGYKYCLYAPSCLTFGIAVPNIVDGWLMVEKGTVGCDRPIELCVLIRVSDAWFLSAILDKCHDSRGWYFNKSKDRLCAEPWGYDPTYWLINYGWLMNHGTLLVDD